MKRWFETQGYVLCTNLAVLRVYRGRPWGWLENIWVGIWYRYYCPRPVIGEWTARACVCGGHCGCDNQMRYRVPATPEGGGITHQPKSRR